MSFPLFWQILFPTPPLPPGVFLYNPQAHSFKSADHIRKELKFRACLPRTSDFLNLLGLTILF